MRMDLIEFGGSGGVFHHTVCAADALGRAGATVVVHTATDHEQIEGMFSYCACFSWRRESGRLRPISIAWNFFARTVPHLLRATGRFVWIQGLFKVPLTFVLAVALRLWRKTTVFSPHNFFSRDGSCLQELLIRLICRICTVPVAYNTSDQERMSYLNAMTIRLPLPMYAPPISFAVWQKWAEICSQNSISVCSVGQLRKDKNLGLLVRTCQAANAGLLIIGEDRGAAEDARVAIDPAGSSVLLFEGYYELEDLAAVCALSAYLALPYSVSSQSGAAGLAMSYGTPVIAAGVGGLSEQAAITVSSLDDHAWTDAIRDAVMRSKERPKAPPLPSRDEADELASSLLGVLSCLR